MVLGFKVVWVSDRGGGGSGCGTQAVVAAMTAITSVVVREDNRNTSHCTLEEQSSVHIICGKSKGK